MAHCVRSMWWPVPKARLRSYTRSPSGRTLYLMWPISWKAQPLGWTAYESFTLRISPLYGTLSPMGPGHPTSRVTSNSTGHTLRFKLTHGLEHPIEWVVPWVRSVPMESLDTPKSDLVAPIRSYMARSRRVKSLHRNWPYPWNDPLDRMPQPISLLGP